MTCVDIGTNAKILKGSLLVEGNQYLSCLWGLLKGHECNPFAKGILSSNDHYDSLTDFSTISIQNTTMLYVSTGKALTAEFNSFPTGRPNCKDTCLT